MRERPSPSSEPEPGVAPGAVECPFCREHDTKLLNPFGGQLSVAQYWCNRCRTGFDYLKWESHDEDEDRA